MNNEGTMKERIPLEIYLYGAVFVLLNGLAYEVDFVPALFFLLGAAIECRVFFLTRQTYGSVTALLILLCINWPGSWTNIFGGTTAELQISWFYLVAAVLAAVLGVNAIKEKQLFEKWHGAALLWYLAVVCLVAVTFFLTSNEIDFLKNVIPLLFYWGILVLCALNENTLERKQSAAIWSVFIAQNVFMAVMIIAQFIMFRAFGFSLFKINLSGSWTGEMQTGFIFLMEDASSATSILGAAVLLASVRANKENGRKFFYTTISWILGIALALTARRGGIVACMASLVLYGVWELMQRRKFKDLLYRHGYDALLCVLMIAFLNIVRPMLSLKNVIQPNRREQGIQAAFEAVERGDVGLLAGTGQGIGEIDVGMDHMIEAAPHNFFLNWMMLGGFLFAIAGSMLLLFLAVLALRKHLYMEILLFVNCFICACVVPDIFDNRFFVVICAMILLQKPILQVGFRASTEQNKYFE